VGHLFTLKQNVPGSIIPTFDISWAPNFLVRKKDFTKKYYEVLLKLAKKAGEITVATDFDTEGEVIGTNIVKLICNQNDAKRMKFSTLTSKELNEAYEKKLENINWGQAYAGETRHYLDWFYGINLSRALMNAIKTTGKFKIMSIGRVQGPTLNLIVKKEKEILSFKPQDYWQVFITLKDPKIQLKHIKDIFNKEEIKNFGDLVGKKAQVQTQKTQQQLPPQPPFNLTSLQTESYKLYGITPSQTMKTAQSLYLAGLISYPRTSSQKLPPTIDYKSILKKLKIKYNVSTLITKEKPLEGQKTDPAHPSIYPTGEKPPILAGQEEKIYNLIVKRFLALFCDNAIINKKRIVAEVNNFKFTTNGSSIEKKSFLEFYPSKLKETHLPDAEGEIEIIEKNTEHKETQPPRRFSPASIISELEKRNLGTKATRSNIIETLYERGYVKGNQIEASPIGISLIETLEQYSPIIINEELTRELERKMEYISVAKKDFEQKEKEVIKKAKETIIKIAKDFNKNENIIGKSLVKAQTQQRETEKKENTLMKCPECGKGELAITYSKKTKRKFIACNAFPECRKTFSLPPKGTLKKTKKECEKCGFPEMMSLMKGRKPWFFCFNPECETNKERIEQYTKN